MIERNQKEQNKLRNEGSRFWAGPQAPSMRRGYGRSCMKRDREVPLVGWLCAGHLDILLENL